MDSVLEQDWWSVKVVRKFSLGKNSHCSQKLTLANRLLGPSKTHSYLMCVWFYVATSSWMLMKTSLMDLITWIWLPSYVTLASYLVKTAFLWLWRNKVPYCEVTQREWHGRTLMVVSGEYLLGNWSPQSSISQGTQCCQQLHEWENISFPITLRWEWNLGLQLCFNFVDDPVKQCSNS